MINRIRTFATGLFLLIATMIITVTIYLQANFSNQSIDEIIFTIFYGLKGASPDIFMSAIVQIIFPLFIVFFILISPTIFATKKQFIVELYFRNRKYRINAFPLKMLYKHKTSYAIVTLVLVIFFSYQIIGIADYMKRVSEYSSIYEDYYIDGRDVKITFPENKRNLIVLYLESVENTMMDQEVGGGWEYDVMPELRALAEKHLNFSHSDKIGGALPASRTQWTVAALVSLTAGIPLSIPIDGNDYTNSENFLAGAYTLGDILKKEGYRLGLLVGSDAGYGGRDHYYTKHGNYEIFDVKRAIAEGRMTEDERVGWGFDDSNLFKWAKEILTDYANSEQPFHLSLLTVNTHFPDGFLESEADIIFPTQYENVHAHASKQVHDFVAWVQKQEFFKDTTLVIVGDHISMQPVDYYESKIPDDYVRTTYNVFINSVIEPIYPHNRQFTNFDLYPTILASIGVNIDGDRLGFGTNLFSDKPTLVEELGYEYVNRELDKSSLYYNQYILQDDFLKLMEQANVE